MFSSTAFVILIVIIITQIIKFFRKTPQSYEVEQIFFLMASILLLMDFAYRSFTIRFPAVTNTYEALVFFTALICLFLYYIVRKIPGPPGKDCAAGHTGVYRLVLFAGSVTAFLFLALASSPLLPATLQPSVPVLQSYWLTVHVLLTFAGEAFFVTASASAIVFLVTSSEDRKREADRISSIAVLTGYFLFTAGGLVFGMIWAEKARGNYWSWDPKETWALVTWLSYTLYLYLRIFMGKRGNLTAVVAIAGLLCGTFTFFLASAI